ncbi:MAG: hypothetical protein K0R79_3630 [Stenotrophomonas indicatrix]|jgi:hypothetical protein|uniref:hypothetical protein n=1 Tax=Stenotrophomonas indicatrix TaxID=2045451 RepID=UPI00242F0A77|nr:hypothetical protein [Stenotrophomonas indicatrix]MDF2483273.1 hypothetical protein [Stenotrophomonas indicatrix]
MAKFIKPFRGVPEGKIYPIQFAAGDDCPPELEAGALSVGALSLIADAPPPLTLLGSSLQPARFEFADGSELSLDDVVRKAHAASGLTVEAWNEMSEEAREMAIAETVQGLIADTTDTADKQNGAGDKVALIGQLEAAGIPFDKRWGPEKLAAALAEGKKD